MYQGYKVKVFIFAGRERTMEVLMPQLKSNYIDEIIVAKNTKNISDLKYLDGLYKKYDKIKYVEVPANKTGPAGWSYLYNFMLEEDTIYLKLDDDIVYLSKNFFEELLKFRIEHPEYICAFPMIVNNSLTSVLRKNSLLNKENLNKSMPEKMIEHFFNGKYGIAEHEDFLNNPNNLAEWDIGNIEFNKNLVIPQKPSIYSKRNGFALLPRPQICAVAMFGKVLKLLDMPNRVRFLNDEEFLTYYVFDFLKNAKNGLTSKCICAHYSFSQQKNEIDKTDILERYKKLV